MSTAFLIESIVASVLTVNAIRPVPGGEIAFGSFFLSWLTMELAPQSVVVQAGPA